ncbi:hypothetical protein EMIT0324P_70245 [Pseudomonas chlororaphis]
MKNLFSYVLKSMPADHQLTVKDSKTVPNDLINYVFPYVVSFMGLDLASDGKFYGFLVFLGSVVMSQTPDGASQ